MTREFPPDYRENTIFMAVGQGGYVGLVRLEEGSLNLAAALDKQTIKKSGSVGKTLAALLEEAGLPEVPAVDEFAWHGTVELTRQTLPPAAERVFVLGDAAGYAEPFTGEGMSWALESAQAVVPLSLQAAEGWKPEFPREWAEITRKIVGRRQQFCRKLSAALRFPWLVRGGVGLLSCFPSLASPLIRTLNASPSPREMEHS